MSTTAHFQVFTPSFTADNSEEEEEEGEHSEWLWEGGQAGGRGGCTLSLVSLEFESDNLDADCLRHDSHGGHVAQGGDIFCKARRKKEENEEEKAGSIYLKQSSQFATGSVADTRAFYTGMITSSSRGSAAALDTHARARTRAHTHRDEQLQLTTEDEMVEAAPCTEHVEEQPHGSSDEERLLSITPIKAHLSHMESKCVEDMHLIGRESKRAGDADMPTVEGIKIVRGGGGGKEVGIGGVEATMKSKETERIRCKEGDAEETQGGDNGETERTKCREGGFEKTQRTASGTSEDGVQKNTIVSDSCLSKSDCCESIDEEGEVADGDFCGALEREMVEVIGGGGVGADMQGGREEGGEGGAKGHTIESPKYVLHSGRKAKLNLGLARAKVPFYPQTPILCLDTFANGMFLPLTQYHIKTREMFFLLYDCTDF